MPNNVSTRCIVTGPDSEITRFRELMFKTYTENKELMTCFDFKRIIPMPPEIDLSEEDNLESLHAEIGQAMIQLRGKSGSTYATGDLYDYQVMRIRQELKMPQESISVVARAWLEKYPDGEKNFHF